MYLCSGYERSCVTHKQVLMDETPELFFFFTHTTAVTIHPPWIRVTTARLNPSCILHCCPLFFHPSSTPARTLPNVSIPSPKPPCAWLLVLSSALCWAQWRDVFLLADVQIIHSNYFAFRLHGQCLFTTFSIFSHFVTCFVQFFFIKIFLNIFFAISMFEF